MRTHTLSITTTPAGPVRSPLKWAGGKRQLLPVLRPWFPEQFSRYLEPFLGGGAVFFELASSGRLTNRGARLTDANRDLIDCYQAIRDQVEAVIDQLQHFAAEHAKRGAEFYYEVRDARFNPARAAGGGATADLAAMLLYLNRTGFNGLYRLNQRGGFNVPAGRYLDPRICDAAQLRAVSEVLNRPGITLRHAGFDAALADAGAGDFVYCDPPYAPLSATASFAHYTEGGFNGRDQQRLQRAVIAAAARGATVLLSNSSAPAIETLYRGKEARAAGLKLHHVPARRAINANASRRGPVFEVLVTNARPVRSALPAPAMLQARLRAAARRLA